MTGLSMPGMSMSGTSLPTTFAQLIQARTGVALVAPKAADPAVRKDQAALSDAEKQRFVDALTALNHPDPTGISAFARLVAIHSDMRHNIHAMGGPDPAADVGQQRFLPWHRVYLHTFEQLLQSVYPEITIPYWDWTNPDQQAVPDWLATLTPTVNIPGPGPGRVTVTRFPGTMGFDIAGVLDGSIDPNLPALADVEQDRAYTAFATGLETIHDLLHVWVGGQRGTMSQLDRAPADPLFWMHHANIDRIWWQWHNSANGQGQNPNLAGPDAIMDPWPVAEPDTRDLAGFHYTYA